MEPLGGAMFDGVSDGRRSTSFMVRRRRPVTTTVPDRPASFGSSGFLIEV
jgi:hypothetical protein